MRRPFLGWLVVVLVAGSLAAEAGARSLLVEAESPRGTLRREIPVVVAEEGAGYVSLDRLARVLGVRRTWEATSRTATLRVQGGTVRLTRDRARVFVAGRPVSLSRPPRVLSGSWMVPVEFATRVLPALDPGVRVSEREARPRARPARAAVTLEDLRFRSYPSFTRVVLEASGAFAFRLEQRPGELRARLVGLALAAPQTEEIADGLVREVRLRPAGPEAELILVLEGAPGTVKSLALQDPYRLVLDVHRPRVAAGGGGEQAEPLRRIVLDAGHGGQDPGAVGPGGLREKEVVLDVTRRVARLVEDGLGIKAVLTRSGDYFVPLRERTQFANKERAQLFVSIHANAHRSSGSQGVETYFLSSEATDNEARQVAALENGVVRLEGGNGRGKLDILKTILWDLAQSEFQEESSQLAETVQDSLTQSLQLASRGVKQAGFYVLGGAAMPAVLVEIGFLTNRREEQRLRDGSYRERVAQAIYAGLVEYKRRYDQKMGISRTAEAPR